jgi:hypothetical protein
MFHDCLNFCFELAAGLAGRVRRETSGRRQPGIDFMKLYFGRNFSLEFWTNFHPKAADSVSHNFGLKNSDF